ncbi:MAG: MFS transporter [Spirochaetota bacterium]|jgi:fucose permease|nr:MFS transporter [Spirochaetota bacterium]
MHTRIGKFSISLVVFTSLFFYGLHITLRSILLRQISEDFGVGYTESGIIFLVGLLSVIAATLIVGKLAKHIGMRTVFTISILGAALMLFTQAMSGLYIIFITAAFLITGFTTGQNISGNSLVAAAFAGDGGAKLNLMHVFYGLGSCFAALACFLAGMESGPGWRGLFTMLAFLLVLVLAWLPFYRFRPPEGARRPENVEFSGALRDPLFQKVALAGIFATGLENCISCWLVYVLEDGAGTTVDFAVLLLALFFGCLALGRACGSMLARRNKLEGLLLPIAILQAGLCILAIVYMQVHPWLFALAGLCCSIYFPTYYYKVAHLCKAAGAGAVFILVTHFGIAFFPFMVGVFGDLLTIRWGLVIVPFCAILLIPAHCLIKREERRHVGLKDACILPRER